ncbi:hypothetical protein [Flavobacterium sp.]|uniref:hypothetical protein n=1 Tax=Flavobacterium sp. TaxID=239 RepID=UPI0026295B4A|nr:hypothetical protein [Flavobacterium sp.]
MDPKTIFYYLLPGAITLVGVLLAFKSDILKDGTDCEVKPYSFANTQLLWWTLIIVCTFSMYYGEHGQIIKLTKSSLILLGISLGTITAAKIIDNTDKSTNASRHQDKNHSSNFVIDIISDGNGISVHRFQAFVFNVIFGLIFLNYFFTNQQFIEFGELELTLMGISSAAYVGLKATENKSVNPQE